MTTSKPFTRFTRALSGLLLSVAVTAGAFAASTDLATEPLSLSIETDNKPNIMFVLDDSGSMYQDFLPDWAGPLLNVDGVVQTPIHRFYNAIYNGVAYNPAVTYSAPVMYSSTSPYAREYTTYPSQTGMSAAQGADMALALPNWQKVKEDGFGIQSTALTNLSSSAFSFTTQAGEYCATAQLRDCIAASAPSTGYTFPAPLRWCNTAAQATGTTAAANNVCQAANINTTATGVTNYTFPRIANPRNAATITVNAGGTVTSVKVSGVELLSAASVTAATGKDLATAIRNSIAACSYVPAGTCTVATGYRAISAGNLVTLYAPAVSTATPVVTGGATVATAFASGGTPGETLLTVISPSIATYAYPGQATKHVNRTDCGETATCSYEQEMTNYANWYAYYHTRMQTMKTGASQAFSNVTDKFRVGYYSINTTGDFLNVGVFKDAQRYNWYSKFLNADINISAAGTPLRIGLANIGRMYAGKVSTLNGVAVTDPMQYSCQQNYTILSTDGYWNDATLPKQIDGTTPVGNWDGSDKRAYYDGSAQWRTVTETKTYQQQQGSNSFLVQSRTQQQQTSTRQLNQSVVTTTTYPWTESNSFLQTQPTLPVQTTRNLVSSTYALNSTTKQLQQKKYGITATPRKLQTLTATYVRTTTPLVRNKYNITKTTTPLVKSEYLITQTSTALKKSEYLITQTTNDLQKSEYLITQTSTALEQKVYGIKVSTAPLITTTTNLKSTVSKQLQRTRTITRDSGDNWATETDNVSSCDVRASGPDSGSTFIKDTTCAYVNLATPVVTRNLTQCTPVLASTGPVSYTVGSPSDCAYDTANPVVTTIPTTCAKVAQSGTFAAPSVDCSYGAYVDQAGQSSCNKLDKSIGPVNYSGPAVACAYETTPMSTTPVTGVAACTTRAQSGTFADTQVTCTYTGTASTSNPSSCTVSSGTAFTQSPYTGPMITCSKATTATVTTVTGAAACTTRADPGPTNFSATRIDCAYVAGATSNPSSCTASTGTAFTQSPYTGPKITCTAAGSPTVTTVTGAAACTERADPGDFSATRVTCAYSGDTTSTPASCTVSTGTAFTQSPYTGPKISCAAATTPTKSVVTGAAACTTRADPGDFSATKVDCDYNGLVAGNPVKTLTNQTSCAKTAASLLQSPFTGPKVECAYETTIASSTSPGNTCTAVLPAASVNQPYYTCTYTGTPTETASTPASCVTVAPSAGPLNYTGPSATCGYSTTMFTPADTATCTPQPLATPIVSCRYIDTTPVLTQQTACTAIADDPTYSTQLARTCAYESTPYETNNVASGVGCTPVTQDTTNFSRAQETCTYETSGAYATNLTTCQNFAQSGAAPFYGPNVVCGFDGVQTNDNASTCSVKDESAAGYANGTLAYTGAKVSCAYAGNVTSSPATCTVHNAQSGPNYTGGAAVTCGYGSASGWSTATGNCSVVVKSTGNVEGTSFPTAVECQYSAASTPAPVATCTEVPQSTDSPYTQLAAKHCVSGSFAVSGAAVVTTVDSCSTDPTATGTLPSSDVVVSTATECQYRTAVVVPTPTCTEIATSTASPYKTDVTCPVSNTGWVPVAPSCTVSGSPSPATFDGNGRIIECKTTDAGGTQPPPAPVPVANCMPVDSTASVTTTNPTSKVQTTCSWLINTTPVAVDGSTCNAGVTGDYVNTFCPTTTTTTAINKQDATGTCVEQSGHAAPYQIVTCPVTDGTSNTLADVAAYYYKTDLRTPALNNCSGGLTDTTPPAAGVLCSNADAMNNVPTLATDPESRSTQHMNTFTLGLGASGFMQFSSPANTSPDYLTVFGTGTHRAIDGIDADPANGVCSWQAANSGSCDWPMPPDTGNVQSTIDDLWHAGVNGHGAYFSATDPVSLSSSITQALSGVASAGGYSAAAGIGNPSVTKGENYAFIPSFTTSSWTGQLVRRMVYGSPPAIATTNDWEAQSKLDAKLFSSRAIYAFDGGSATKLKSFDSTNFGSNTYFSQAYLLAAGFTQYACQSADTCLAAGDQDATHASGGKLVDFLRGDRSNEGELKDNTKYYRLRTHVLGDTVNSSAVFVSKPRFSYVDKGYAAFISSFDPNATPTAGTLRQAVVYVGANDGMLHAFAAKGSVNAAGCNTNGTSTETECLVDYATAAKEAAYLDPSDPTKALAAAAAATAATTALAADTVMGKELWAYVPTKVLPNLYKLADKQYKDNHAYYVDATPVVGDVCVSSCLASDAPAAVWKTILVGGLGRGGRGFYALDITNPASPKALWEFSDDNMGYSYGNPEITKLQDGTWVVLLSSGYNNIANADGTGGDGVGRLYVVNAATGALIRSIETSAGTASEPSGLAQIIAQVVSSKYDNTSEAVYGGDLNGNLWRFDVNDSLGATGYDAQLLAVLKDGAGNRQSITVRPEVSEIPTTYEKIVFVGTGRYLHKNDALGTSDASKQQTLYGIKDPRALGTTPSTAIFDNPGGSPRGAAGSTSAAGFIQQGVSIVDCPSGTASYICAAGEKVRSSTSFTVDYATKNGWFNDLVQVSERVNTNPALASGALVFNTNLPSSSPCADGTSYQYWLSYLTGGALASAENPGGVLGVTLGNFLISGPTIIQGGDGRNYVVSVPSSGGMGGSNGVNGTDNGETKASMRKIPPPPEDTPLRRTGWRELIRH